MCKSGTTVSGTNAYIPSLFDIVEFYPSISPKLLNQAIEFASAYTHISDMEKDIVTKARNSILIHKGDHWVKKSTANIFVITMRSYDGAEIYDLVGTYNILSETTTALGPNVGLYRDDRLAMLRATP